MRMIVEGRGPRAASSVPWSVAAKSMQSDEPNDVVASKMARIAGAPPWPGGVVGLVLDGRARRRRPRTAGSRPAG